MQEQDRLRVRPLGRHLAAEIVGLDLSGNLDEDVVDQIRNALLRHLVLIFHDQVLSPAQHARFARRFGALQRHDYVPGLPEQPDVMEIRKEPDHAQNFGGVWHSDNSYLPAPPLGSILYAVEIPSYGGDTLWSSQYSAYDGLPPRLKEIVDPLFAVHSPGAAFGTMSRLDGGFSAEGQREVIHPLVRTHPATGRRSLFHSGTCTIGVQGWPADRSQPLLDHLMACATSEEITYRHQWNEQDVVFWDNRCTLHMAMNDYGGQRRVVRRVSIQGTVPTGAV